MAIRRANLDEVAQSRALRLEMLADSPRSFVGKLDVVQNWSTARWESQLHSALAPDSTLIVAADESGKWVGQAAGRLFGHYDPPRIYLLGVYLTPTYRHQGLVDMLVVEVQRWAVTMGVVEIFLDVHESAVAARNAYRRLGFRPTGVTAPYIHDSETEEIEMVKTLTV